MVAAARPLRLAAFCVADDSRFISTANRAAAAVLRARGNDRPGQRLGDAGGAFRRKIRTYERRPE
jgi:hypothetical protein